EAAVAFGATPIQLLRKIELPFATPQIMAGLTQTIMLSLSMVVIAFLDRQRGVGHTEHQTGGGADLVARFALVDHGKRGFRPIAE
ncbi:hypothetical protein AB9F35_35035, partial [Rhizobium leguminosarum]